MPRYSKEDEGEPVVGVGSFRGRRGWVNKVMSPGPLNMWQRVDIEWKSGKKETVFSDEFRIKDWES